MANVDVRTAAGGLLSIPVVPADVVDRCDTCGRTFREGDWYCPDLGDWYEHPIARLTDRSTPFSS